MRGLAIELPSQLRTGFARGAELESAIRRDARLAVAVGMGGSGVAAELVRAVTEPEIDLALGVVRGPSIPRWVGPRTLVLLTSYSGTTWETLAAYDAAGRQGAHRVTVSAGGELAQRAERDRVPHLQLPPGLPPRVAVGYLVGGLLGLLDGFFPESNETRLARATERLGALQSRFISDRGEPARLARAVGPRLISIYAPGELDAVAHRWATQVEENGKRLAEHATIPEVLHNAVAALKASPPSIARERAIVLLERSRGQGPVHRAADHVGALARRRGFIARRVVLEPDDRLEAVLTGVSFGDHFSLALAQAARVDPFASEACERARRAAAPP
jgi:glucose/mannose-6-phosphate isomerase